MFGLALTNFAPRLGLACDVFGNQRTLVRAGFGLFYSPITGSGGNHLNGVSKFPYESTSTATSTDGLTAVSTLAAGLSSFLKTPSPALTWVTEPTFKFSRPTPLPGCGVSI